MTDEVTQDPVANVLGCSIAFYGALGSILGGEQEIGSHRDLMTQGTIATVFEHGASIILLVETPHLASASVLLRAQFEALVRALWLHYIADDAWIEKYFAKVQADPRKDPNISRGMDEMLKDLAAKAPRGVASKLQPLKDGAWGHLNSYVHSGIHSIVHQHAGVPEAFALATLRNANGLTAMAAMLATELSGDPQRVFQVLEVQYAHLDCLPPVNPTPAPLPNSGE
jgi:hypothetical protein